MGVPKGDLFVGVCLRDFNYNQAVSRSSMIVRDAAMRFAPPSSYVAWGDRCRAAEVEDAEFASLVTDMSGWDQIIQTKAGEIPPNLNGELSGQGLERTSL